MSVMLFIGTQFSISTPERERERARERERERESARARERELRQIHTFMHSYVCIIHTTYTHTDRQTHTYMRDGWAD